VRRLQEEKAAMETENRELKRQNQYFQDLISKKINVSLPTHDMQPDPGNFKPSDSLDSREEPLVRTTGALKCNESSNDTFHELGEDNLPLIEQAPGNFLKRQKRDEMETGGLMRHDSFFSDRPQFDLFTRNQNSFKNNQRGSFPGNAEIFKEEESDLVLERMPQQNFFFSSGSLFGLTIMCVVLGVVSNVYSEEQTVAQHTFSTS